MRSGGSPNRVLPPASAKNQCEPLTVLPRYSRDIMSQPTQPPRIILTQTPDYRETYANSVQVRVSVWDFLLTFGTAQQQTPEEVTIHNQQGIYLSPQQAKALWNMLGQNLEQYEMTFGKIALEPLQQPHGQVH